MSVEIVILAKLPLPERPSGWRGQFGPKPLWYAAVELSVTPWEGSSSAAYADRVLAQGGCAQVLRLSCRSGAVEFADRYEDVLFAATGGTKVVNGAHVVSMEPRPTSLDAIEAAFFEHDLAGLAYEPPPKGTRDQLMDEATYRLAYGRPRPRFAPDVDLVYLVTGAPTPVRGVKVESLREWVGSEPNLLAIAAQGRGSTARHRTVVTVLRGIDLPREEERARERLLDSLVDRHEGRELAIPEAWLDPYPEW